MRKENKNSIERLGLIVVMGLLLMIGSIYLIAKNRSILSTSFRLNTTFKNLGGLQTGDKVRFAGIDVGTVENIFLVNDTSAVTELLIDEEVRRFIKRDALAVISSESLVGSKLVNILPGSVGQKPVLDGDTLATTVPLKMDDLLGNIKTATNDIAIIGDNISYIASNTKKGRGVVGQYMNNASMGKNIDSTMKHLKKIQNQLP